MRRPILMLAAVCAVAICASAQVAAAASAPRAVIRVNQVGYRPGDAKRAVLLSTVSEAGARFAVVNGAGNTVLRGRGGTRAASLERTVPVRAHHRLQRRSCSRRRPHRRHRTGTGLITTVSGGGKRGALLGAAAKLGAVLPGPARRPQRDRVGARPQAITRQRRHRNHLRRARVSVRLADRRSQSARGHPQRLGRLVRRRRLHQARPDDELHRGDPPDRGSPKPGETLAAQPKPQGRGPVRTRLAQQDVGRLDADAVLPGRNRRRQRLRFDLRRSRHLAAAAGRRHLRRQ